MKNNVNLLKRALSIMVMIAVLASAVVISSTVFAGTGVKPVGASATLSYSFAGGNRDAAGFAEGEITLKANDSSGAGTYYLYWADDTKALSGYYEIDKVNATTGGVKTKMYPQTAIPADATKVIAIKSSSEPGDKSVANASAVYNIPQNKLFPHKSSEKNYSFASYSDIHIANDSYGSGVYPYDEVHWRKALDSAAARDVDFIVTGGDNVNNQNGGSQYVSEWKTYQKILADSDYCNPIYESIGNHEMWSGSNGTRDFIKATGLKCDDESLKETNKAYYTFDEPKTGDHFIIMSLEYSFNPKENDEFSSAQLNWLKGLLAKYKGDGHNTYIYEHAGFWKWGVGDDENDPYYDIPLSLNYSGNKELQNILYSYPDAFFFCGHTHIYFRAQYNFMDYDSVAGKRTAQMYHNSSIGGIRKPYDVSSHLGQMDRTNRENETEGYFVDCYGDYVVCNGANVYYNKIDPQTTYISVGTGKPNSSVTPSKSYSVTYNVASSSYLTPSNTARSVKEGSEYKCVLSDNSGKKPSETEIYEKTVKVTMGGDDITSSVVTSSGNDINKSFTINISKVTGNIVITAKCTVTTVSPSSSDPKQYKLGDVNLDNQVNVSDVTLTQKAANRMVVLTDVQKKVADFNGDNNVDIRDATAIQKYSLKMISTDRPLISVGVGRNELSALLDTVKTYLNSKYTYSSYDQYMALKKEYRYCSENINSFTSSQADSYYKSLSEKYEALQKIAGEVSVNGYDLYFRNTSNWSTVYAYTWNSAGAKNDSWPGELMTKVKDNIYTIHADSNMENIIFNNNSTKTGDLTIPGTNYIYDFSTKSWSQYNK